MVYDPSMHDYTTDQPFWQEIRKEHYVLANKKEAEEYKKLYER